MHEALETTRSSLVSACVVDAVDDGLVGAGRGGGDEDALRAVVEVDLRLLPVGEDAGAFEGDVDVAPRQLGGVAQRGDADRAAADVDRVAGDGDGAGEAAVDAVVAHQVGVGLDRTEVVERDDLDVGAAQLDDRAQHVAPDAAEAVDCNLHRHGLSLARSCGRPADRAGRMTSCAPLGARPAPTGGRGPGCTRIRPGPDTGPGAAAASHAEGGGGPGPPRTRPAGRPGRRRDGDACAGGAGRRGRSDAGPARGRTRRFRAGQAGRVRVRATASRQPA